MAGPYRGTLTQVGGGGAEVRLTAFGLQEGYSTGWSGTAVVVGGRNDRPLNPGGMMSAVMASGVVAGTPMVLDLEMAGGPLEGVQVRTWPSVVTALRPYPVDETSSACDIHLMDPVSYLAERPVWGAYRGVSAAEAVGGALSLAAGGDGKPGMNPVLQGLPVIEIVAEYRDALASVPYVIAAGQRLGDWLADFLAMLGLRAELFGREGGRLQLTLTDGKPRRQPLSMSVVTAQGIDPATTDSVGAIAIQGHSAFPGTALRGAMLDDPAKGGARPLVATGPVGTLLTEVELDVDEATRRVYQAAQGKYAEMFMLTALSRQPRIRPGETVALSRKIHGLARWQVSSVTHWLRDGAYDNDATLIRGDLAWYPELPPYRPPVYVSAVVDGSNDHEFHQPVARDRLGRVKVVFPFTPTPTGQEGLEHAVAEDQRRPQRRRRGPGGRAQLLAGVVRRRVPPHGRSGERADRDADGIARVQGDGRGFRRTRRRRRFGHDVGPFRCAHHRRRGLTVPGMHVFRRAARRNAVRRLRGHAEWHGVARGLADAARGPGRRMVRHAAAEPAARRA